jgi:predicted MPP superfamily phosphohydrolase
VADLARVTGRILLGGAAAAVGCVAYGVLIERHAFVLRRVTVPCLPDGSPEVRVLHLSDLHLTPDRRRLIDWVRGLADLRPDLVVNTGDNVGSASAVPMLQEAYGPLAGVPGVFVFGSNDLYGPRIVNPLAYVGIGPHLDQGDRPELPTGAIRELLEGLGWTDVEHRRTTMSLGSVTIEVRGTRDAHLELDDYSLVAGPPAGDVDLSMFVTHAPYLRLLDAATADGVELLIAGHTHGGQVCVPGYGALTTNCDLDTARVKGLSTHTAAGRTSWLHVSAGLGTAPTAPFRFACRPEATLMTLVERNVR